MRARLAWRSRLFWEAPGLYLILGARDVCLLPIPRRRRANG